MKECIERVAILQAIEESEPDVMADYGEYYGSEWGFSRSKLSEIIRGMPAADVVEVRHGRWVPEVHHTYLPVEYDDAGYPVLHEYTSYRCSLCGREETKEEPYCHCGAHMDKEDEYEKSKPI